MGLRIAVRASFAQAGRREFCRGTLNALVWGSVIGGLLGIGFLLLPHSNLVVKGLLCGVELILLLASGFALTSVVVLLPVEAAVAWRVSRRVNNVEFGTGSGSGRFYGAVIVCGTAAIGMSLWAAFDLFKDPRSLEACMAYAAIGLVASFAVWAITRRQRVVSDSRWSDSYSSAAVLGGVVVCALVAVATYHSLRGDAAPMDLPPVSVTAPTDIGVRPRANVILVSIDTLRADHLSSFGYRRDTSVNLGRLAAEGTKFVHAQSQAPWTLPSHATMFTSLYPSSHGARFSSQHADIIDMLDDSHLTLAEELSRYGIHTAAFTSAHWFHDRWNLLQGFEMRDRSEVSPVSTPTVLGKARRWLDGRDREPFFVFVHLFDVHEYSTPDAYDHSYKDPDYHGELEGDRSKVARNLYSDIPPEDLAYLIDRYDSSVRYVDEELGRFFDWLRTKGLFDGSIIVVTSDHGEEFWDHRGTGHGFTLYEDQLHVPLIIKPAAFMKPVRSIVTDRVGVIDIMPTVLELLKIPIPDMLQGASLRAPMHGQRLPDRALFAEDTYFLNSYVTIEADKKYFENDIPPSDLSNPALAFVNLRALFKFRRSELYDLAVDPHERNNLATRESTLGARLRARLLTHVRIENRGRRRIMDAATHERLRALGYAE